VRAGRGALRLGTPGFPYPAVAGQTREAVRCHASRPATRGDLAGGVRSAFGSRVQGWFDVEDGSLVQCLQWPLALLSFGENWHSLHHSDRPAHGTVSTGSRSTSPPERSGSLSASAGQPTCAGLLQAGSTTAGGAPGETGKTRPWCRPGSGS